jgi:hypothetical protein
MTEEHISSASETLDAIRNGGQALLMTVRMRVKEAEKAMDEGKFGLALGRLSEASGMLSPLAHAETNIAIAGNAYLVRAKDLTVGMELVHLGVIEEVETDPCDEHGEHVKVKADGRQLGFLPEVQLYVARDAQT